MQDAFNPNDYEPEYFPVQQPSFIPPKLREEGIIKFQLDSDEKVRSIIETFMGGYYDKNDLDENGLPKFKQTGEPLMNKSGVYQLIKPMVDGISGKEVWLSTADDEEVSEFWKDTVRLGVYAIWNRKQRLQFGIDKGNRDRIQNLIENLVFFSVRRASGGRTFELLNTQVSYNESNLSQQQPKQGVGWGLFGGGKQ